MILAMIGVMETTSELPPNPQATTQPPAPKKSKSFYERRAHRSHDPFASINKRTLAGKRTADFVARYLELLGNPTGVDILARIISAAELQVLAEQARFKALEQTIVDAAVLDQIVRLESAAARAVRRLGLDQVKRKPDGPSLDTYLASKREVQP
jgi:hypothetical protein